MVIFFLGNTVLAYSQKETATSLLKKISKYYQNTEAYQINMEYKMYKGLTGNEVTESYTGHLIKKKNIYQLKIANNEMLTINNKQMAIDHGQKIAVYRSSNQASNATLIDVAGFLEYYDGLSVDKVNGLIKCVLIAKNKKQSVPYAKIALFINPNNYSVEKQEMYFASQLPFILENGDYISDFGRLSIEMKEVDNLLTDAVLSFNNYFNESDDGEIVLANRYKDYQFIDERN
ncbi:hypothetical protein A8C32_10385 [Flavivirga aquatica]|uniref:Outer membrane lipoprotein-sorting protein n=2 Tax=Flavivirga aquatica TaxID=1849968 RepID=A0A1E5TCL6_9FLAO|nr:hypothetical protein A8C32_10385 [Flavivirga aquatica]